MRLIDADELINKLCEDCFGECPRECYEVHLIKAQPTIDIVRCVECIHRDYICDDYCYEHERNIKDNDFCSYGERRADGDI